MELSRQAHQQWMSNMLTDEIFKTLGINPQSFWRRSGGHLLANPTMRLSTLALDIDLRIAESSINEALGVLLSFFSHPPQLTGVEHVPNDGPLIVMPNHPGTVDTLALISSIPRPDINVIAGYTPITERLQNLRRHLIYTNKHSQQGTEAVRDSLRYLGEGGSILLYPAGRIEPDPAVVPGALDSISDWSRSVELFLRRVPQANVVPVIVSHMLLPRFANHLLARIRKTARDKQRTAEMLQIVTQIVRRDQYPLSPRITFGSPTNYDEIVKNADEGKPFDFILARAKDMMKAHVAQFEHESPPLELASVS